MQDSLDSTPFSPLNNASCYCVCEVIISDFCRLLQKIIRNIKNLF